MEQLINSKFEKKFEQEARQELWMQSLEKRQEERARKKREELLANKAKRESEVPKKKPHDPKDRWKVGKTLLELQKQFPMDDIIRQMVKEEFKNNRVFRYIEEYEVYDEEEETARKIASSQLEDARDRVKYPKSTKERLKNKRQKDRNKGGEIIIPVDEMTELKQNREKMVSKLRKEAEPELQQAKQEKNKEKGEMEVLIKHLEGEIKKYFELREQRLEKKTGTLKNFIASTYQAMAKAYPSEMERFFPFPDYMKVGGVLKNANEPKQPHHEESKEAKKEKQYPREFKGFFLEHFRQYVAVRKGKYVKLKQQKAPVWIPSSKPCSTDKGLTLGESTARSTNAKGKTSSNKVPIARSNTFQLHPWNCQNEEIKKKMEKILGSYSDVENCTFRPYIKPSSSFYAFSKLQFKPADEIIPEEEVNKMGQNFQDKFPDVYKSGMYNKALKQFNAGNNIEAIRSLNAGFNMKSLIRNLHPNYKQYAEYFPG